MLQAPQRLPPWRQSPPRQWERELPLQLLEKLPQKVLRPLQLMLELP